MRRAAEHNRLKRTGCTNVQFKELLALQDGVCAVCKQPETNTYKGKIRELAVDHCHDTKAIRGLLCSRCNMVLGKVRDDSELLRKLAEYLDTAFSLVD